MIAEVEIPRLPNMAVTLHYSLLLFEDSYTVDSFTSWTTRTIQEIM